MYWQRLTGFADRTSLLIAAMLASSAVGSVARAQPPAKPPVKAPAPAPPKGPEFTRQGVLIVNFEARAGADARLGRRAGGAVRSRVEKISNRRDSEIFEGGAIDNRLLRAGFDPDAPFSVSTVRAMSKFLRADEYFSGWVTNGPTGPTLGGELVMTRDERLRQVIAPVGARTLDSAATLFARSIASARLQLVPARRCENALRDGDGAKALAAATEGVRGYPRSVIARTCLMWAQRSTRAPATDILRTAREILAIDSTSVHALESGAIALDSLRRRDESATYWLRLAASDTSDIELAVRVAYSMLDGGSSVRAEPFITRMAASYPDDLQLQQLKFRSAYENKNWASAIESAELLLSRDSITRADSAFYLRLGIAYQSHRQPVKAVEVLARGVTMFPKDARLYSLYSQYIRSEADTVIPRGLALFPRSAELVAMNARELRARGKVEESLESTKLALSLDSTMRQGHIQIAQLELLMSRPDSALTALHRGLAIGEDSTLVAQFALGEGNTLFRAANASRTLTDYRNAFAFLAFADSVRSTTSARFLIGATALAIAQTVITAAAQTPDKGVACTQVREGTELIPVSRTGLEAGREMYTEPARQQLEFLEKLDAYAQQQVRMLCEGASAR